jgi:hypothetical protein
LRATTHHFTHTSVGFFHFTKSNSQKHWFILQMQLHQKQVLTSIGQFDTDKKKVLSIFRGGGSPYLDVLVQRLGQTNTEKKSQKLKAEASTQEP